MASDSRPLSETIAKDLNSFLQEWMDRANIPGLSIAVFDDDAVHYAVGLGEQNVESHTPATPETLYAVASLTKPFTAVATLQLVDRCELEIDDQIDQYLPVLTDIPGEPITIRDLLSHSSGMPRDFVHVDNFDDGRDLDLLEHIDGAADQRLTDHPRYMYYNSGYFLLGKLIETVDGRSYPEYVRDEVFEPLGMARSTFDPAALDADDDAMVGYHQTDDGLEPDSIEDGAGAAGGLISSVSELVSLPQCVLNGGKYDGNRLLSSDLVEAMSRLQSPPLPSENESRAGYGFGWEVEEFLGETLVSHRGGIGIAGGYMGVLPERGVGVTMAYNALGHPAIAIGKGVLASVCGEDREEVVPLLRQFEVVRSVTGTYTAYRDAMTVTVRKAQAGAILVEVEHPNLTFIAAPEGIDGETYRFSQVLGGGRKWVVEFDTGGSTREMTLSLGKWTARLTEVESDQ